MAVTVADLRVKFSADAGGVQKAIRNVDKDIGKLRTNVKNAMGSINLGDMLNVAGGQLIGNAIGRITGSLVSLGGEAISAYAEIERLGMSLETFSARELMNAGFADDMSSALAMSGERAEELLEWIRKLAIQSPFEAGDISDAFRLAQAYGFSSDEAMRLTQAITDFAAGAGISGKMMDRISLALGQIRARGKMSAQELNQLSEAGINARQILAHTFGVSTAEITEMIEKGLVPADLAIEAITQNLEKDFGGAAKRQAETFSGLISSLRDIKKFALVDFFGGTAQAVQPVLADIVTMLQDPEVTEAIKSWGDALGQYVATKLEGIRSVIGESTTFSGGLFAALGNLTGGEVSISADGLVTTVDWGDWVGTLDWNNYVFSLTWGDYIAQYNWEDKTTSLEWDDWLIELDWDDSVGKIVWGDWVFDLDWNNYVGRMDWSSNIKIDWEKYIPFLTWAEYLPDIRWDDRINIFEWGNYVEVLDWDAKIYAMNWGDFAVILNWGDWLFSLQWGDFITSVNLADLIPAFPGWDALLWGSEAPPDNSSAFDSNGTFNYGFGNNAQGTDYWQGGWTWVGERGPELLNLPRGSRILSNQDSMKMIGQNAEGTGYNPWPVQSSRPDLSVAREIGAKFRAAGDDVGTKIRKEMEKAAKELERTLRKIPGLFSTSAVTPQQMELANLGVPQNFADDYVRRLTDEVINGVDWEGVDIKDAAARAGIDPNLPAEAILQLFKDAWNDSSLFANQENLDLINQDAVREALARQAAAQAGQANIMQLFGITQAQATGQAVALGGTIRTGIEQGLTAPTNVDNKGLLGDLTNVTPEQMAPVGVTIIDGLTAEMGKPEHGEKIGSVISDLLSSFLQDTTALANVSSGIMKRIADGIGTASGFDMVDKFADAFRRQIELPDSIQTLMDLGERILEYVFQGYSDAARDKDWPNATVQLPSSPPDSQVGANASGTNYWRGGLTWVGEQGPELVSLPRGSRIFNNSASMQMATAAPEPSPIYVTVNANVSDKLDMEDMAYRIADVIRRRQR